MPTFANNPISVYVVYDANVFDMGFSVMDIIPSLTKIIVEEEYKQIEAGQAVAIVINIQDLMTTIGQRFDFNPEETPQIQIYNPDMTLLLDFSDMNFIQDGYYIYQHQTTEDDQVGLYRARFKAVNGTMTMFTDVYPVFRVTSVV